MPFWFGVLAFLMKSNLVKTHFVVGTAGIVGNQFKFVGLHAVMLCKGFNFIAAHVFCCHRTFLCQSSTLHY